MKLSQMFRFCKLCNRNGLRIELGADGYCPDCRSEMDRLAREEAEAVERERQEEIERRRKMTLRCDKCQRNGLYTEIAIGSVCNDCRARYPRIRDHLRETEQTYQKWFLCNLDYIRLCRRKYIAFDLETTGLSPLTDRIIELSAVVFENYKPTATFSTLVNPERGIPRSASDVNGIFNADVADAPYIHEAIEDFCEFIGADALTGEIPMVAHNADFDIKFLLKAFSTCGVSANIFLQDTLYMSNWMNRELHRHRLCDVASYFGVDQQQAHRASDDARVCGEIFAKMLMKQEPRLLEKKSQLTPMELEICEWLKSEAESEGLNTQLLTVKAGKTFCAIKCVEEIIRIKVRGNKPYILLPQDFPIPDGLEVAHTTKSEGEGNIRVHFTRSEDLLPLRDYLVSRYRLTLDCALEKINISLRDFQLASENAAREISL